MRGGTVLLLAASLVCGCNFASWRSIERPGESQVIRVESGDRLFMRLEDEPGCRWSGKCDDPDVDLRIDHEAGEAVKGMVGTPGLAKVEIRVHRGYDGPSTVMFTCKRSRDREVVKKFTISLFKNTGDRAFWE